MQPCFFLHGLILDPCIGCNALSAEGAITTESFGMMIDKMRCLLVQLTLSICTPSIRRRCPDTHQRQ